MTKQSTGVEIVEKAGHRNPEVWRFHMMLHLQLVCIVISIFFPQLQYTCVSFKIPCQYWYFCPIYYDQKYSTEFNSFKMKIFTNIWRVTFCLYVVQRTCKFWNKKYIYYGLHRKQAFRLQKQNLLCCYLLVVSKHVPKHVPNISF